MSRNMVVAGLVFGTLYAGLSLAAFAEQPAEEERGSTVRPMASVFSPGEEFQFTPPRPGSYRLNAIKPAPGGTVVDIKGNGQNLADLMKDRITLVSFVYLNCADEHGCPMATATLFQIHDASIKLPALRDKVQLMTISFDPQRDDAKAMADFAYPITLDDQADQKIPWQVLTTTGQEALQPILDGFGQTVDRTGDRDTINHLLRMYLVDDKGMIRNVYALGFLDPRLLVTDIETLLMEEEKS